MKLRIKNIFSPNFDKSLRSLNSIKYIIIHYTGMQSERETIQKLCNSNEKVSCHYLINRKGIIFRLVEDKRVAWHAGKSCWNGDKNLNKKSIGIELVNKGHEFGYTNFKKKQIISLVSLCRKLITKYNIRERNVIGHSDIAPERKSDPGEKFPWMYLAEKKIGKWHKLRQHYLKKLRNIRVERKIQKKNFLKNLSKIGYCTDSCSNPGYYLMVVKAFQRHFRKELINGFLDQETMVIAEKLTIVLKNT